MNLKTLILLMAGHFVTDINTGALPAFLPFIKESLNLSYTVTASVILIFNVTSSVIQPVFGYFSDRSSGRWLLPAGCFVASLGMGLLGLGSSYVWILFFAGLSGLGQGGYHPEAFKTVHGAGGDKKASAISLFLVGGSLGLSVGPFAATVFFEYLGLRGSLLFLPFGIAMAAVFLATPSWKVEIDLSSRRSKGQGSPGSTRQRFVPMMLLLIAVILRSATQLSLQVFIPFYFIQILKRDPLTAGKYVSMLLLMGTIGSLAGGPLADRYGYKRTVLFSLGLTTLFLYLFSCTKGTESFLFFAAAGLMLHLPSAIMMAMGQSFMPENLGMASGLILGLAMGIGGIGTTLLGWAADRWGLSLALQITFILPLLGLIPFLFVPSSIRERERSS